MKELYIAPELELVRFTPAEQLMDNEVVDNIFGQDGNGPSEDPDYIFNMPL